MRFVLLAVLLAGCAQLRGGQFKVGPAVSVVEYHPGQAHPVQAISGGGVQAGYEKDGYSVDVAALGAVDSQLGPVAADLKGALFGCYTGFCLGADYAVGSTAPLTPAQRIGVIFSANWEALSTLHFKQGENADAGLTLQ